MRQKRIITLIIFFTLFFSILVANDSRSFINIETKVEPRVIVMGEEGILKIKVTPASTMRISSSPEFVVRLNESDSGVVFTKNFFTASELEFKTQQEGSNIFLNLGKEILIPFKIESTDSSSDIQSHNHRISGKIIYTAVEKKDSWSVKTFQTFSTYFKSKIKKNKKQKRSARK